jgi:polar amino acid transport system substrate-binding protein
MFSPRTSTNVRLRLRGRWSLASALLAVVVAACSSQPAAQSPSRGVSADKLAQIAARGTIVLWTDPAYAPQSFAVEGAKRLAMTKCAPNQMTAPEMSGYDAETGKLVAEALAVEACFVATPFDSMIAGSWGDRYDVAWASGALTVGRMEKLYVTQPYYSTPASFFVREDSPVARPAELKGKQIGACAGCTHESYLKRELELPGVKMEWFVEDPVIVTFNTEVPGLDAVIAGEIDAFLCSATVGRAAIAEGAPLRELEDIAYYTQKTGYLDRDLTLDPVALLGAIDSAIADSHASGRLRELSLEFFEADYATPAADFDLSAVGQNVP